MPVKTRHQRRSSQRYQPYPMTDVGPKGLEDFINTGRSGRRNALADIRDTKHANTSTSSLPFELEKLQCSDKDDESEKTEASPSSHAESDTESKTSKEKPKEDKKET